MQKIQNYIKTISKSRFVKNLGITFFENITTKIFGFFITLMLVRGLGPENYGIYSIVFVNVYVLSALFDFGMENTAIRFSNQDKNNQDNIFGLYFLVKLTILIFCILILFFLGKDILLISNKPELIKYLPFFLCGFVGESLFFVNDTYLQSIQKFTLRAIINITRYIILFSFVVVLMLKKLLLLKYVMFVWVIPILFTLFFIPRYINFIKSFFSQKLSNSLLIEIFNYEKWMFFLAGVNSLLSRIDIYMLSFWVSYTQIGIYSAAFNLLSVVSFLPLVLGKVMLPKMAETKKEDLFDLTIKIVKPIILLSCLSLLVIPIFPYLVPILFGHKYDDSIVIVQILTISTLISFILLPFEQSLYPLGKPKYMVFLKFIQLIFNVLLNFIFVPRYGMIWAAVNLIFARVIYGILLIKVFNTEKRALNL